MRGRSTGPVDRATAVDHILAMAPNPWHGPWMNRQQILSRLAASGAHILYTTGPWCSWHRHDPAWRAAPTFGRVDRADGVRIEHAPRWLMRVPRLPVVDRVSIALEARRLRSLLPGAGRAGFTLYIFHPAFQPWVEALRPTHLVYHAYDLFALTPDWTPELARGEQWLLAHADLRIASSSITAAHHERAVSRSVHTLPNGADIDRFDRARREPAPSDLAAIPYPRVGYVGQINIKVDLALIAELAGRRPQWHFVLVGEIGALDDGTTEALVRCRALPNVHELGSKPYTGVPGYVAHLDVGLMPYRMRPDLWTVAGSPLKLYEYLAAGRPVVSVEMAAIRPFRNLIPTAGSADEWERAIATALAGDGPGPERRHSAVAGHDWSDRVATLQRWLNELSASDDPRSSARRRADGSPAPLSTPVDPAHGPE